MSIIRDKLCMNVCVFSVLLLSCFLGRLVFVIVSLLFEFIIFWVWLDSVAESVHCLNVAALVRKEIQDETDRITGKSKQISPVPIHLSIFSPHGCALIHSVDFLLLVILLFLLVLTWTFVPLFGNSCESDTH